MNRQTANIEILNQISAMVEKEPSLRFHQILQNLNIQVTQIDFDEDGRPTGLLICKDLYHEESIKTLERMNTLNA